MSNSLKSLNLITNINKIHYHYPVMINNILNNINEFIINKKVNNFNYIDCTLGLGNHFNNIYKTFNEYINKSILIDKDINSINLTINFLKQEKIINNNNFLLISLNKNELIENDYLNYKFYFINENFKNLINYKFLTNEEEILIIIVDLGISMYQIKNELGFSFNKDTLLDMRYDKSQEITAKYILNKYSQQDLLEVFNKILSYKDTKKIVNEIVKYREKKEIETTQELNKIITKIFSAKFLKDYLQKVYLSLRIETNNELNDLKEFLENIPKIKNKSLFFIISYHSLEGKIIKRFLKENNLKYKKEKPSKDEVKINKPSRSALLWIFSNF